MAAWRLVPERRQTAAAAAAAAGETYISAAQQHVGAASSKHTLQTVHKTLMMAWTLVSEGTAAAAAAVYRTGRQQHKVQSAGQSCKPGRHE
jgi:hypothetical protein